MTDIIKKLHFEKLHFTIVKFFTSGHARTIRAKKQVLYSFFLKLISIIISLLYVPLLIDYLDVDRYGIWLTLTSIVGWFTFFDAGLGNGLRNKLSEAIANNKTKLAKEYVSTTYAIVTVIFTIVLLIFYGVNSLLDWGKILNTQNVPKNELSLLALIVFTFFFIKFIFKLIGSITLAYQMPALNNLFGPTGNLISITIIYLITFFSKGHFILLGTVLSVVPVLVLLVATLILFNGRFKVIKPNLSFVNKRHVSDLMGMGIKFFLIQIAALVMFSLSNIIIIQYLDAEQVTLYNIAYKYFQIPVMVFAIIVSPIWSAVTEAFVVKDNEWLRGTLKRLNKISLIFTLGIFLMLLISNYAYGLWLGDRVEIPLKLSMSMALYATINVLLSPFSSYINGLGKLALSMRIVVFKIIAFVPVAILLVNTRLEASGVMFATCIFNGINIPIFFVQVKKILSGKATGIWIR